MDGSISSPLRRKYSGPIRLRATTTEIPTFHLERGRDRVGGQHQKRDEGLDGLLGWRAGESRERGWRKWPTKESNSWKVSWVQSGPIVQDLP